MILNDLRYYHIFPKRYAQPLDAVPSDARGRARYWRAVSKRYGDEEKRLSCTDYHWHIITYKDGRKELAYLRSLKGGLFGGGTPAIFRGILIPRKMSHTTYSCIENIRLAF